MKYAQQVQTAMNRLDQSLFRLRDMIKRGENKAAIDYMQEGQLKECYEELQNIINLSSTENLGARGTSQTGAL
tara:strand:+ start:296 stop:514 length:219 start_codon:yes stop_codon:yes gene_type:complete